MSKDDVIQGLSGVSDALVALLPAVAGPTGTIISRIVLPSLQVASTWLTETPRSAEEYARLWERTEKLIAAADALMDTAAAAKPPEGSV